MIFNTWIYAVFTLVTFVIYWFFVPKKWRSTVLLLASYIFFTYHFPLHTILIVIMTLLVYYLSLLIFKFKPILDQGQTLPWYKHPKLYLTIIIVFNVAILSYYKYLKMVIATLNNLLHWSGIESHYTIPSILVPLGLSFYVFEFIHYAIDVYKGKAQKTNLFQFAVFIMYFPSLVSGPIKRYEPFRKQLEEISNFKKEYLYEGFSRILIGLGKKVIIADQMTPYANYLLTPSTSSVAHLWIGMYAYALKIYFDFSGYSDIAIGSARLFGYKLPENFNYPYLQKNLSEFWNHWHMSLSSWIKDYVYIPLGGSRGSVWFTMRNLILAMAISGLWHGASWHFVIWGLYHGFGQAFLRFYKHLKKDKNFNFSPEVRFGSQASLLPKITGLKNWISVLFTFHFVAFGWILFYCDFHTAVHDYLKMIRGILTL